MSKAKAERRLDDDSAQAIGTAIRSSARKLNLVAASIRGKKVVDALTALDFTKRRVAREVKRVLQAAVANAENNHSLDVDRLIVSEATVGRSFVMKRWMPRGRGKSSRFEKPFSRLTVIVQEKEAPQKRRRGAENAKNSTSAATGAAKSETAQAGA